MRMGARGGGPTPYATPSSMLLPRCPALLTPAVPTRASFAVIDSPAQSNRSIRPVRKLVSLGAHHLRDSENRLSIASVCPRMDPGLGDGEGVNGHEDGESSDRLEQRPHHQGCVARGWTG